MFREIRDCNERITNNVDWIEIEIRKRYHKYLLDILQNQTLEDFENAMSEQQYRIIAIKQIAKELSWEEYKKENKLEFDPNKRITDEYLKSLAEAEKEFEREFEIIWTSIIL